MRKLVAPLPQGESTKRLSEKKNVKKYVKKNKEKKICLEDAEACCTVAARREHKEAL